jgi:putative inorganic carbon (HCO3(-)) transporter
MEQQKNLTAENKIVYYCDKIIEYGIYALVFFVPLVFWTETYDMFELIKMIFLFNITLFILVAWIIKSIENNKIQFNKTALFWASIIYFITLVISTINSQSVLRSLYGVYKQYQGLFVNLSYLILFLVIINNIDKSKIKNILFSTISSGTLVAIYGIFQSFGYDPIFKMSDYFGGRSASTLGNPIFLGNFLTMVLPISIIFLITFSPVWSKIFFGFSTVIMFLCLLFTYSRGAWLAFILSLILIVILLRKEIIKKDNIKWFMGLSMVMILVIIGFSKREIISVNKKITTIERAISIINLSEPAIGARLNIWQSTLKIIRDYQLFGTGLDCFGVIFPLYQNREFNKFEGLSITAFKSHNEILQIASTTGFIGLFGWLFLITIILIKTLNFLKSSNDKFLSFVNIAIICGLFAYFISEQFSFNIITTGMMFWVFAGIIDISNKKHQKIEISKWLNKANKIKYCIYIVIFLIILANINFTTKLLYADYYYYKGMSTLNLDKLNCKKAIYYFEKARKINPLVPDYCFQLGFCYSSMGNINLAKNEYLKTVKFKPNDPNLLYNLGLVYYKTGDYDSSIYYFKKAEKIYQIMNPTHYRIYYYLGLSYGKKGLVNDAINSFKKSLKIKPDFAICHFNIANAYLLKGEKIHAIQHLKKVIDLESNSEIGRKANEILQRVLSKI